MSVIHDSISKMFQNVVKLFSFLEGFASRGPFLHYFVFDDLMFKMFRQ